MKRPPFTMKASTRAALTCDGKFIVGGRASFVWETFLMRRVAGVPGEHMIRREQDGPWHRIAWTVDEAEEALLAWGMFGPKRVAQMRRMRQSRADRGLPVDSPNKSGVSCNTSINERRR